MRYTNRFNPGAPEDSPYDQREPSFIVAKIDTRATADEKDKDVGNTFGVKIVRDLTQSGAKREMVFKKATKLLAFLHDKVEPFLGYSNFDPWK